MNLETNKMRKTLFTPFYLPGNKLYNLKKSNSFKNAVHQSSSTRRQKKKNRKHPFKHCTAYVLAEWHTFSWLIQIMMKDFTSSFQLTRLQTQLPTLPHNAHYGSLLLWFLPRSDDLKKQKKKTCLLSCVPIFKENEDQIVIFFPNSKNTAVYVNIFDT